MVKIERRMKKNILIVHFFTQSKFLMYKPVKTILKHRLPHTKCPELYSSGPSHWLWLSLKITVILINK